MGRFLLALSVAALCLLLPVSPAHAAVFTVDTTEDLANANAGSTVCVTAGNRGCSLRAAITAANNQSGADAIVLRPGTYALAAVLGALRVTREATIEGAGARTTIIDGGGRTSVLWFTGSGTSQLRGVTVTGSAGGSALYVNGQNLIADRIAVRDNAGGSSGGGIRIETGDVRLTRSAVTGNTLQSGGSQPQGGGIFVGTAGSLVGDTVTLAGNRVTGDGVAAFGGGLIAHGPVELRHATIWGNAVAGNGSQGASVHVAAAGSLRLGDAILGGGIGGSQQCGGTAPALIGVNVGGGTGCGFATADPRLAPLADAGGPTNVLVPAYDSPAIGRAATCFADGVDQRGQAAPAGASCDVGAVELGADLVTTFAPVTPTVLDGAVATLLLTVANPGLDAAVGAAVDVAVANGTVVSAQAVGAGCSVGATARCELGTLARGAAAGIVVAVRATGEGPVQATATASSLVADPSPADATATATVLVARPAPPLPPPGTDPPGNGDRPPGAEAPRLTAVRAAGRPRAGRPLRLTAILSRAATVTVKVDRVVSGRKSGRGRRARCRAGARSGKPCTAYPPVGTVRTRSLQAGRIAITIPARLNRKRLARGAYRLTLTARAADGRQSRAVVLRRVRLR